MKVKKKHKQKFRKIDFLGLGKEQDYFIDNLALLLSSGLNISAALEAIAAGIRSKTMKRAVLAIKEDIDDGEVLSEALQRIPLLPTYALSLVKTGEQSGTLNENLRTAALQQQKDRVLYSKIKSAMLYPIIVVALTVAVGLSISWFILPRLSSVFSSLNIELPWLTEILILVGNFLSAYGAYAIPAALLGLMAAGYFLFFNKKTNALGQIILFNLPVGGNLVQEIEITRMGYIMGTLLKAGVPLLEAVRLLAESTNSRYYKKFYRFLHDSLEEGNSFFKAFAQYKHIDRIIPKPIQQIVISGEQSGNLAESFFLIAGNYEQKTETTTKNLSVLLEPILLVIVWLMVLFVALAVIMPIYRLTGGVNASRSQTTNPAPANPTPTPTPPPTPRLEKIRLIDELNFSNVRALPTTSSPIVGELEPDTEYEFIKFEKGWYEVKLSDGNKTGWVIQRNVQRLEE